MEKEDFPNLETRASLCPILMLPNELLTEIFNFYLPPYPTAPKIAGPGSPTYLLGVCRAWRTVVLNSPNLWRAMGIRPKGSADLGRDAGVLRQWLVRSGTVPISLNLILRANEDADPEQAAFVAAVLANRSRWEYFRWRLDWERVHLITGPAPSIVDLNIGTSYQPPSHRQILRLDGATPHLRSVTLWNVGFGASSFEWKRLTTLALVNTDIEDCLTALGQATALIRCKLHMSTAGRQWAPLPGKTILPLLETFIVDGGSSDALDTDIAQVANPSQNWWGQFVLPSLRRLAASYNLLDPPGREALQLLASRSNCRLERLRVLTFAWIDLDFSDYREPVARMWSHVVTDLADADDVASADDEWRYEMYWEPRVDTVEEPHTSLSESHS
ncbi:F-box domain-containing protein [Mycena chlorophos]|uniref:F-box domain-containing protein n=1 Tax=Mycena chlorophos TaxID=658473 RepID=A0A8H6S6S2_MYCCL|nr:F-box domain-containing protein [Mycena chlorophos]